MNRSRVITTLLVAAALLSATLLAVGEPAQADSSRPRQVAVVIADGPSVRDTEGASELVISFVGLLATLQSDRLVVFINMDDPSDVLGPFLASDPNLIGMRDEIERRLLSPYTQRGGDLVDALQEAQVVLGNERAEAGSTAYVITGSMPTADNGGLAGRMPFVTAQFNNKGWSINGVGLDGTSSATRELLYEISSGTGGESFELSIPDGFQRLQRDAQRGGERVPDRAGVPGADTEPAHEFHRRRRARHRRNHHPPVQGEPVRIAEAAEPVGL